MLKRLFNFNEIHLNWLLLSKLQKKCLNYILYIKALTNPFLLSLHSYNNLNKLTFS